MMSKYIDNFVSIITPTYNSRSFIVDTIRSVQNQTFGNWELLIADDCSKGGDTILFIVFSLNIVILVAAHSSKFACCSTGTKSALYLYNAYCEICAKSKLVFIQTVR